MASVTLQKSRKLMTDGGRDPLRLAISGSRSGCEVMSEGSVVGREASSSEKPVGQLHSMRGSKFLLRTRANAES